MVKFVLRRLLEMIPVLLIVATATFFMIRLAPGGPFSRERNIPPEVLRNLEKHYGLDQPLWKQYLSYMGKLLHGDLGPSFKYPTRSVNELIADSFPVSMELGACGLLIALSLGIPAGVFAALRPNTRQDFITMGVAMTGICLPNFVIGPLLVLLFAIKWEMFNASGWFVWQDRFLPALTLGIAFAARVARLTRGGMLEVLNQDYIRTARAKGLSESAVVIRHALKLGLMPVIAYLGPAIAGILTGSFVVETLYQIPGLGRFFVTAAFNRDYTMVLGTVLFYATLILLLNFVVDLVQIWLNPKLKYD